jgi:hypothetical protein
MRFLLFATIVRRKHEDPRKGPKYEQKNTFDFRIRRSVVLRKR